jgi:hypothetical protein
MNKLKFIILLLSLFYGAHLNAKWKLIYKSMDGRVFIDDEFIQRSSGNLKVIIYEDLTFPRLEKIKSVQHLVDFDCPNKQFIIRRSVFYSEKNLQGETIADVSDVTSWTEIETDSYANAIRTKYCK